MITKIIGKSGTMMFSKPDKKPLTLDLIIKDYNINDQLLMRTIRLSHHIGNVSRHSLRNPEHDYTNQP
jgi:hypothetical protein